MVNKDVYKLYGMTSWP